MSKRIDYASIEPTEQEMHDLCGLIVAEIVIASYVRDIVKKEMASGCKG